MDLSRQQRSDFLETLGGFYAKSGRGTLPWRHTEPGGSFDPYKVMVSELMLQQTQVARVIPKYQAFLAQFPTVKALAGAGLGDVLRAWQGLGYNRRAKYLWQAAQTLAPKSEPWNYDDLVACPGIGPNTAGAILAYAYGRPAIFIETNVRTVYIHHFFSGRTDVTDKEIRTLLERTLERDHPREFYWALMDYGTYLKTTVGNLGRASKHYTKQPKFHGSRRAVRGHVIRLLGERPYRLAELRAAIPDERLMGVLAELASEGLIRQNRSGYGLE